MKKKFIINDYVYNETLVVCVGYNADEMLKFVKKYTKENIKEVENNLKMEGVGACYFKAIGISESFIWMPEFDFNPEIFAQLSHELCHYINIERRVKSILLLIL